MHFKINVSVSIKSHLKKTGENGNSSIFLTDHFEDSFDESDYGFKNDLEYIDGIYHFRYYQYFECLFLSIFSEQKDKNGAS